MKNILPLFLLCAILTTAGCKNGSLTEPESRGKVEDRDSSGIYVRKPNIYIYPETDRQIKVKIYFPLGGKVIESIPEYNSGWNVFVTKDGLIDDKFNYLFYESSNPDRTQKENGWLIKKEGLKSFFEMNMKESGFNQSEINDFTDYWIPILIDYNYFEIYPQYKTQMDKMIIINATPEADNVFRLIYLIKGRNDSNINLPAPTIETAKREGFHIIEWGVIIK